MNRAAGRIAQRQSGTLIAALRTRVADQSSDACQYFRIIAEGCLCAARLSFSLRMSRFLSATFYPVNSLPASSCGSFLLLLCRRPCWLEFARKAKRVSRGKPNDVMQDRFSFFFFFALSPF